MNFQIVITFFLVLALSVSSLSQTPFIMIDSLSGKAETQRESKSKWQFVSTGEKLYDNDVIRTLPVSHLRLRFADSILVFLKSRSQIQINLLRSTNKVRCHITLVTGTTFINVSNSYIKKCKCELTVHSSAMTACPLDASFLISAKPDKFVELQILQGILPINKIKDRSNHYLGSPYKILIGFNNDPIQHSALLEQEIDSLKNWIPSGIIEYIMEKQLIKSRRNFEILNGKLENKCLFTLLKNESGYKGSWDIQKNMTVFLAQRLHRSDTRINTEIIDTMVNDPVQLASLKKARFLITGEIIAFDIIQHAEITTQADEYRELRIARVKLNITLTETQSSNNLLSNTFTGEISQKRKKENDWETVKLLPFDLQDSSFSTSILGQATIQALDQTVENIIPILEERK
ncbi:MAG TPA: hypothetical protein VHP36_01250 [Chitinispirillaceae bacterium]|nr:hypothetical protein [Chitinispirillaceae bacterium]